MFMITIIFVHLVFGKICCGWEQVSAKSHNEELKRNMKIYLIATP